MPDVWLHAPQRKKCPIFPERAKPLAIDIIPYKKRGATAGERTENDARSHRLAGASDRGDTGGIDIKLTPCRRRTSSKETRRSTAKQKQPGRSQNVSGGQRSRTCYSPVSVSGKPPQHTDLRRERQR